MANDVKIIIYLKGREKPVTFHDKISKDDTFQQKVNYFFEMMKGKSKGISVIDFSDDNIILPTDQIDFVIVSKPSLDSGSIRAAEKEEDDGKDESPLDMMSDDNDEEETEEDDVAAEKESSIEVID
jgi:hypothetical protein